MLLQDLNYIILNYIVLKYIILHKILMSLKVFFALSKFYAEIIFFTKSLVKTHTRKGLLHQLSLKYKFSKQQSTKQGGC